MMQNIYARYFFYKLFLAILLSCCLMLIKLPAGIAAIQGEAGPSSSGQILLRFKINPSYQISRVDDIVIEVSNINKTVTYKERLCIRGPKNSGFAITAKSEQKNRFAVLSSDGDIIPFNVFFYKNLSDQTPDRLHPSIRSKSYKTNNNALNCNGEDNSAVEIVILPEHLKHAKVGDYYGVLILTVGSL